MTEQWYPGQRLQFGGDLSPYPGAVVKGEVSLAEADFSPGADSGAGTNPHTHSNMSFGNGGLLAVLITGHVGNVRTLSSVTVDGNTPTTAIIKNYDDSGTTSNTAIFYIDVGATASGDVVITWSGNTTNSTVTLVEVIGSSGAHADTASDDTSVLTLTIDVPKDGAVIGVAQSTNATGSYTWANVDEVRDLDVSVSDIFSYATKTYDTLQTGLAVTATFSGTNARCSGCAVSFGP